MRYKFDVSINQHENIISIVVNPECTEDLILDYNDEFSDRLTAQSLGMINVYKEIQEGRYSSLFMYGSTPTNYSVLKDVFKDCTNKSLLMIAYSYHPELRDDLLQGQVLDTNLFPTTVTIFNITSLDEQSIK